jgi:ribosomal protein S27AE
MMADDRERRFPCTKCGTEVVTMLPMGEIANKDTCSVLILSHENNPVCPSCGQAFLFVLSGVTGMQFGWKEDPKFQKKAESGIIEVPSFSLAELEKMRKQRPQ